MPKSKLRHRAVATVRSLTLAATLSLLIAAPLTATAQETSDSSPAATSEPGAAQERCRYKPLPASHIKVRVCRGEEAEYRLQRSVRVMQQGVFAPGAAIPAPLPQVQ